MVRGVSIPAVNVEEIKSSSNLMTVMNMKSFYEATQFGEYFRTIDKLWTCEDRAIAMVSQKGSHQGFCLEPAVFDAALHMAMVFFNGLVFLPYHIQCVDMISVTAPSEMCVVMTLNERQANRIVVNSTLFNLLDGSVIVKLTNLTFMAAPPETMARVGRPTSWMVDWAELPSDFASEYVGKCIVFVEPLSSLLDPAADPWPDNFVCVDSLKEMRNYVSQGETEGAYSGDADAIVYVPPPCLNPEDAGSYLETFLELINAKVTPKLIVLVTCGAQGLSVSSPGLSSLWGLARVACNENTASGKSDCTRILCLDISPTRYSVSELENQLKNLPSLAVREIVVDEAGRRYSPLLKEAPLLTSEISTVLVHKQATYVISGGLGSLGILAAQWLIEQGATNVVLLSRRKGYTVSSDDEGWAFIKGSGAIVRVLQCDVASLSDVTRCLSVACSIDAPLRGVIHSAGVIDDAFMENQTFGKLLAVMAPKAHGAWNLHKATKGIPLDMFLLYSSVASLLGTLSQGNYAAANAYLDALAQYRRELGLPGVSIQWGPWNTGMTMRGVNADGAKLIRGMGMKPIESRVGMTLFGDLISTELSQVALMHINWTKYVGMLGANPMLTHLLGEAVYTGKSKLEVFALIMCERKCMTLAWIKIRVRIRSRTQIRIRIKIAIEIAVRIRIRIMIVIAISIGIMIRIRIRIAIAIRIAISIRIRISTTSTMFSYYKLILPQHPNRLVFFATTSSISFSPFKYT